MFTKFATLLALAAVAVNSAAAGANDRPIVHPSVHRTLRQQATANIFVSFRAGTEEAIASVEEATFANRGEKIASLVDRLEAHAREAQKEVTGLLSKEASSSLFTKTQSYWISNEVFIENASAELIEKLAQMPSVAEIKEEEVLELFPVTPVEATGNNTILANEYGVEKVGAPLAWARGFKGQGIVVGSIDTGVRSTHQALRGNFRGANYGWFDPEAKRPAPYDNNGHGSHTMGTIAGAGGIGVAPSATWITCKGCRTSSCPQSDLLACFQFMTCPTDTNGNNKDCTKAPRLVSNSWGGGQGTTTYNAAISAWRSAGIIPIFANGNSGPRCRTANSPADNANVIAVGATDSSDTVATFSSKGPAVSGLVKPDISAPGVSTRSAWNSGDAAYNAISGTSMATPHVAGAVAVLLSARPALTYDQIRNALTKTAFRGVTTGQNCGAAADGKTNHAGYGRINVNDALKSVGA